MVSFASVSEFTPPPPSIDTGTGIAPPLTSRVMLSSLVSELVIVSCVSPASGTKVWLWSTVIDSLVRETTTVASRGLDVFWNDDGGASVTVTVVPLRTVSPEPE